MIGPHPYPFFIFLSFFEAPNLRKPGNRGLALDEKIYKGKKPHRNRRIPSLWFLEHYISREREAALISIWGAIRGWLGAPSGMRPVEGRTGLAECTRSRLPGNFICVLPSGHSIVPRQPAAGWKICFTSNPRTLKKEGLKETGKTWFT